MTRQQGFTLIEMLVAMAIFAALIAVLMLGFQQGLLLWDKAQRQSHDWLKTEFRYGLLDTLFAQAIISDNQYKNGLYASYFIGTPTDIKLLSAAPIMDIKGRVHPVELQAIQDEQHTWRLRYREATRYSDIDRGIRWDNNWIDILTDLQHITFSFLAPAFPLPEELDKRWLTEEEKLRYRDTPEWVTDYDSRQRWLNPVQIAMDFTDQKGREHHWLFTLSESPDAWSMEIYEDN